MAAGDESGETVFSLKGRERGFQGCKERLPLRVQLTETVAKHAMSH